MNQILQHEIERKNQSNIATQRERKRRLKRRRETNLDDEEGLENRERIIDLEEIGIFFQMRMN